MTYGAASALGGGGQSTAPGQQPPLNQSPPTISGNFQVGSGLTASSGSWDGNGLSFAYQWLRCGAGGAGCSAIAGATDSGYAEVGADAGATIRVTVIASNHNGSAAATSDPTSPVSGSAPATSPSTSSTTSTTVPTSTTAKTGTTSTTASTTTTTTTTPTPTTTTTTTTTPTTTTTTTQPVPQPGYAFCAWENSACSFSGSLQVIYGANGTFTAPQVFTGGVQCNNTTFGDPLVGTVKHCETAPATAAPATTTLTTTTAAASPTGTVLRQINYEANNTTGVDTSIGGWQCADTEPTTPGFLRGSLTKDASTAESGAASGLYNLPDSAGQRAACEVLVSHTQKTGQDIYYSLAVRFPSNWNGPANFDAGKVTLAFPEYIAIFGPIELDAYNNRVSLSLEAGQCSYSNGCVYSNDLGGEVAADTTPGHVNVPCAPNNGPNPFGGVPGCKLIPTGQLQTGVWNEFVIHVHESPRTDGMIEGWWRIKGQTAWQKTVTMTGTPTLELGVDDFGVNYTAATYDAGITGWDKFGVQTFNWPATQINEDSNCVATSFDAAASCFN